MKKDQERIMMKDLITINNQIPLGEPKRRRIWELDFTRGICVLLMIWDHLMFDIISMFGPTWVQADSKFDGILEFATKYWEGGLRELFHPIIFCIFFVLCGISCSLSRNNLIRGIQAVMFAFGISIVTGLLGKDMTIRFGVLHMLAFSIIFWCIIDFVARHNKKVTSLLCFAIGLTIILVNEVYMANPPEFAPGLEFLAEWYHTDYYSADYFPLLPNVGYVLLGASVGHFWYGDKKSLAPSLDRYNWHMPVGIWGRLALWVYILHQPVVIGILSLVSFLFITPGNWIFM